MKKETLGYICPQTKKQCDDECCVSAEDCHIEVSFDIVSDCEPPKQETLEEASQRIFNGFGDITKPSAIKRALELVKWQQERSYSKEEVLQLLKKFYQFNNFNGTIEEWLEQFKNK